jgi:hypothetical protein
MMTMVLGVMVMLFTVTALGIAFVAMATERRHGTTPPTPDACAVADRSLAADARDIDRSSVGETRVARLLGLEFGMSEEAIAAQHEGLGASWGNLTIAHTFAASDRPGMTVAQVLQLHDRGMGWGHVAAGLGFELGDAVRAVNEVSQVARGRARPRRPMTSIEHDGF